MFLKARAGGARSSSRDGDEIQKEGMKANRERRNCAWEIGWKKSERVKHWSGLETGKDTWMSSSCVDLSQGFSTFFSRYTPSGGSSQTCRRKVHTWRPPPPTPLTALHHCHPPPPTARCRHSTLLSQDWSHVRLHGLLMGLMPDHLRVAHQQLAEPHVQLAVGEQRVAAAWVGGCWWQHRAVGGSTIPHTTFPSIPRGMYTPRLTTLM